MSFRLDSYAHEQLARQRAEELARKAAAHRSLVSTTSQGRVRTPVAGALRAIANRLSPQTDAGTTSQSGVIHIQMPEGRR